MARRGNILEDAAVAVGLNILIRKLFPGHEKEIDMDAVNALVKSAWASKINWTAGITLLFNIAMVLGHPVPPDIQAAVVALGNAAGLILIWVMRTWFSPTVTTASAKTAGL